MGPYSYALSMCDERSVLVIEARGTIHYAAGGGIGRASLVGRRVAAILTDDHIRDRDRLTMHAEDTNTKFATGGFTLQYRAGRMLTPAEVNVPVALHQSLVTPGDYIFGNADGVAIAGGSAFGILTGVGAQAGIVSMVAAVWPLGSSVGRKSR
jgi:regulator of RNase E activity RraA